MRDLATGMLGMSFFGDKLCKNINVDDDSQGLTSLGRETVFASAMSRCYDDTVTFTVFSLRHLFRAFPHDDPSTSFTLRFPSIDVLIMSRLKGACLLASLI